MDLIGNDEARINITWQGQNGDLPDPVRYDANDADVLGFVSEAIRGGNIPGIAADADVNLQGFMVERFPAQEDLPNRLVVRAKTAFG